MRLVGNRLWGDGGGVLRNPFPLPIDPDASNQNTRTIESPLMRITVVSISTAVL